MAIVAIASEDNAISSPLKSVSIDGKARYSTLKMFSSN